MKKKIVTWLLLLSPFLVLAQHNGTIVINWNPTKPMNMGEYSVRIPSFNSTNFQYDPINKVVLFSTLINGYLANDKISLTNITYENINNKELGDLSASNIPTTPNETIHLSTSRDLTVTFLTLSPIIKDGFGFKKITSFSYSIPSNSNRTTNQNKTTIVKSLSNSVLASGNWYQFQIQKSGVYKISRSFLQQLGLPANSLNPRNIKIFGNGGKMIPLTNTNSYPLDLEETPIQIIGENDGTFNNEDYILFYGEGTDTWNTESKTFNNLYEDQSYYYITTDGGAGKRIQTANQPSGSPTLNLSTFDDTQFHELDQINIGQLGRQWFGEKFDINNEQEFDFEFPNIDATIPVKISTETASAAFTASSFIVSANNSPIGTINFPPLSNNSGISFYTGNLSNTASFIGLEKNKIKYTYNNGGVPNAIGYLDYIKVIAKRKLVGYGKQFHFQYDAAFSTNGIVEYSIANATTITQVWDVTQLNAIQKIENSNQPKFSFKANLGEIKKYIALDANDFLTPTVSKKAKVANQNIKGTIFKNNQGQFEDIDYVIIAPSFLSNQAEKLATFHRNYSNLNVKVIPIELIYHEFASGKQDIGAIRNCIKYIYDNASAPEKRVKYVNLFGDASYDYKNRINNNSNIVPIYHSLRSNTTGESSFASDDFFGLMDPNEGNIANTFGGVDIAVGRMIVNDTKQAEEMVQKVIDYHDSKSFGNWRNNFVLVADDSDVTSDASLQEKQNNLGDLISNEKPFLNVSKILLDSYIQEASAGGFRYPKARTDLFNAFEKGALVFNYLGHGGEDGLAVERIWEKSDSQNLNNPFKYPLFVTITCEFSRFDNPLRPTAGEYTYWNPKGGAIAMITTIRSIGQFSAENFNPLLTKNLLSFGTNTYVSMAEALRISKNTNPNSSTNVVIFIGDPALQLAIAKPKINLTKVNDVSISQPIDDFKSLAKIKLSGEVTDENNNLLPNYNGTIATLITDKSVTRNTINNDGNSPSISFKVLGETIFRGNATVKNGQFEFSFVVPRDIRIPIGNGRISFYAKKDNALENQTGQNTSIKIGGINENAIADNISPKVKLYMNDENFVSGGTTNQSPILIAKLEDENGINTASGIGHDIVAILDGDESNPFILNDYYETQLDDFTSGTIKFPFRNLSIGLHTITIKAWDVYNNPVISEIQFLVVGNESITLTNVLNYPNPFVNYTEFWFTHNRPFEPLEVQVQVMTITGKLVWTKNQIITTEGFLSREIKWDGRDDFGDRLGKGVYVYRLTVKSSLNNKKAEKIEKLVIL
ncbi:type IX secretion system sortase PorU [Flavobacterium sp.]|uniref:type IX secretion system sortase PorU n=1 Tax=Flavobacterium sp. TaxID=239 RepID=UPI0022C40F1F|nr:type IX secretion system sortase PorU [Flavobacterium sp.]MCZ8227730.1 type IX secretion system sortase PorU [Flavobacterium sp.]